jgi:hypothetical protein
MPDDFKARVLALLEEWERHHKTQLDDAFRKGGEQMRDLILRAAQSPTMTTQAAAPDPVDKVSMAGTAQRAPRGSVGRAIDAVLSEKPGLLVPQLEEAVLEADPEVARKSVGNHLRHLEGTKYKRDRPGGYRWFLIHQQVDQVAGEPTPQPSAS